jgi:hypothetical protein
MFRAYYQRTQGMWRIERASVLLIPTYTHANPRTHTYVYKHKSKTSNKQIKKKYTTKCTHRRLSVLNVPPCC